MTVIMNVNQSEISMTVTAGGCIPCDHVFKVRLTENIRQELTRNEK